MLKTVQMLHVGTKHHEPLNIDNPPLSFMTNDKTPQGTMKSWCGSSKSVKNEDTGEWEQVKLTEIVHTFVNEPQAGFKILESVSRWSTSNKWFRVADPRGFQLEISASNLCNLILDCEIKNGLILSPCVWCRNDGNVLVAVDSEEYQKAIEGTKKLAQKSIPNSALKVGYTYSTKAGYKEKVYLGQNGKELIFANTYNDCFYFCGIDVVKSHTYSTEGKQLDNLNKKVQNTIVKHREYIKDAEVRMSQYSRHPFYNSFYKERALKEIANYENIILILSKLL